MMLGFHCVAKSQTVRYRCTILRSIVLLPHIIIYNIYYKSKQTRNKSHFEFKEGVEFEMTVAVVRKQEAIL